MNIQTRAARAPETKSVDADVSEAFEELHVRLRGLQAVTMTSAWPRSNAAAAPMS
jgi:hypothetical protein